MTAVRVQRASRLRALRTLGRLGAANLARVAVYRALTKAGVYRSLTPLRPPLVGPFFDFSACQPGQLTAPADIDKLRNVGLADEVLAGHLYAFSHQAVADRFPPDWSRSVISSVTLPSSAVHWSLLPDFGLAGGDVKGFWELSRFDGLLTLTKGWLCSSDARHREAIESWMSSWCASNPANAGLQWKCGQETGLRLLQTLLSWHLMHQWAGVKPTNALFEWVAQHCERIAPTMLYAIGQDNNHGTSEACALLVAGWVLDTQASGPMRDRGRRWAAIGRRWLEDRMQRLVMPDGSFSQHSVNYHRVMLDTVCLAETLRRAYGADSFSAKFIARCAGATHWLAALTDPVSGGAPNLGANDGARLFVLGPEPYRDFRPTVRWAQCLFDTSACLPQDVNDERLKWLQLSCPSPSATTRAVSTTQLFDDGGYVRMGSSAAWALLRLPRFRFRPSHADALHVDLWVRGRNVLCDAGTFSYNTQDTWLRYFAGTGSHNTVQFDGRDQMPRLSRFLFGDWLSCEDLAVDTDCRRASAAYTDSAGARHHREIRMTDDRLVVTDTLQGSFDTAVLRWRLNSDLASIRHDGLSCHNGSIRIDVSCSAPVARAACVEGWHSLYYNEKEPLAVFEIEVASAATLTSTITWPA